MTKEEKAKELIAKGGECTNERCSDCPCDDGIPGGEGGCGERYNREHWAARVEICKAFLNHIQPTPEDTEVVKHAAEQLLSIEGKPSDPVNHPDHYTSGGVECIEAIRASMSEEAFKGFLKGNVLKYLWRYEKKIAPTEDLKKAEFYLKKLIEEMK